MATVHGDAWQKHLDELEKFNNPTNFSPDAFKTEKNSPTELDDYFSLTFTEATTMGETEVGELSLDVYEDENNLYILAPLAGADKDTLTAKVENDVLTIMGKRAPDLDLSAKTAIYAECFWGDFSRSIVLPKPVDVGGVIATYKKGCLSLILPKLTPPDTSVININASED